MKACFWEQWPSTACEISNRKEQKTKKKTPPPSKKKNNNKEKAQIFGNIVDVGREDETGGGIGRSGSSVGDHFHVALDRPAEQMFPVWC